MPKKKVFVSYDHSEDATYKYLLQAWDANSQFEFEFDSRGPDVAIDSTNATTIKQSLTQMMKDATHLLVIVGAKSSKSKWISWEIDRAKLNNRRLGRIIKGLQNLYASVRSRPAPPNSPQ
jgi:NADPH:quinone reductase-like Zn-dependent oxidoreductase